MTSHDGGRARPNADERPLPLRPRMPHLPFNDPNASWMWFEEAVRDLFRRIDGFTNVNFYGAAGDAQKGIDISADSTERGHVGIQAKKVATFGAGDVAAAVTKATTYAADNFILALSIKASLRTRLEVGKHAKWDLWDQIRLSDVVRDLPLDEAIDYVERHFAEGTVAAFLGRGRPTTFISRELFFAPFEDPSRPINHLWSRVGPDAPLDELQSFLASDQRVGLIQGPIGIGKTKLLFDFTSTQRNDVAIAFHATGTRITADALRELRFGPQLVIVDDAAGVDGLAALLAHVLRTPELKLVLTGPIGNASLYETVLEAGFVPGEVRSVGLARLTREPTIALVQQVIEGEDAQIEEAVVNYAISSPLDTIFTARVLKKQQHSPNDFKSSAEVRELVRSLYLEVATGAIADDIPKDDVKATLHILAALGPAKIEEDAWLEAAAAVIEMDLDRLLRTLDAIEDAGILVRRGFHYFIAPEMLRQQILLAALIVRGRPTAFARRLVAHFPNDAHLLLNLAIVDLESQSSDGPDVFTPVWNDVRAEVIAANSLDRSQFLDNLKELGFHKPAEVYELVSYLVDHPATNEDTQPFVSAGFGLDHDDVLREIPSVLRYVMLGSLDLVARCVSLLWRLGRDCQVRSHEDPLRMVTELARYEVGASTGMATRIIDAVARLIDAGEADTPQRSLIDLIVPILARDISMTASRGTKFTISRTVLSVASVHPLRDRAIHLVAAAAKGNDGRRAYRAIELLIDLMRDPENQIADPAPEVVADWDRERAMAFDALDDIVDAGAWPLRELQMAYALRFYAAYGRSNLVRTHGSAILAKLGPTVDRDRYRMLIDRFLTFDAFIDVRRDEPSVGEQRRAEFLKETVAQLLADLDDPDLVLDDLAGRLALIERAGIAGSPWQVFWEIVRVRPELGGPLGEAILERGEPAFLQTIAPFVSTRIERNAAEGEAFALRVLNQGSIEAAIGVANALSMREAASDRDGSVREALFARLLADPRIAVRLAAAHNLLFFRARYPQRIVALVLAARIEDDANLADRIFMALPRDVEELGDAVLRALTEKLVDVPELEYFALAFLTQIAEAHPSVVMDLLRKRIFEGPEEREYRPVPFVGREIDALMAQLAGTPEFEEEIIALSGLAAATPRSRERFALFVGHLAKAAPNIVKRLVTAAMASEEPERQQAGASWLRYVPHVMIMEDVDYVIDLLERAHAVSSDLGIHTEGPITNALVSGAEAVGHYEAAPSDIRLTAFSDAALQREGLSPAVRRFLENLRKTGLNNAKRSIRSAEEAFGLQ
jgi:hypothetical protein